MYYSDNMKNIEKNHRPVLHTAIPSVYSDQKANPNPL